MSRKLENMLSSKKHFLSKGTLTNFLVSLFIYPLFVSYSVNANPDVTELSGYDVLTPSVASGSCNERFDLKRFFLTRNKGSDDPWSLAEARKLENGNWNFATPNRPEPQEYTHIPPLYATLTPNPASVGRSCFEWGMTVNGVDKRVFRVCAAEVITFGGCIEALELKQPFHWDPTMNCSEVFSALNASGVLPQ